MVEKVRVVGLAEVAQLLGVSKRTATRYVARADFPEAAAHLAMGPIWLTDDVEEWARSRRIRRGRPPKST